MARSRNFKQTQVDEKQLEKDLKIVAEILDCYSVKPGDDVRYRRINDADGGGTWYPARVIGINSDLSLLCIEDGRFRSFVPNRVFELQAKGRGPKGGVIWTQITSTLGV